ncbi:MAG TPA: cytochrome c-type biogenesis protein CcmH [Candidatus Acidoferrales bacterium]|nr:cytochrome c-type biogenesis protein CcmH [Candidatus Acidoferrales bacterium]
MTERRLRTRSGVCALGIFTLALIAPLAPIARAQESAHTKELGQKLRCVCGCNQILGSCNHVGCTYSHDMMKELEDRIARNEPDDLTLQAFVQEYGPTVLSSPPAKGFNRIAWIAPVVVPLIALALLLDVVRRWKRKSAVATASGPGVSAELIARAQRESDKDNGS